MPPRNRKENYNRLREVGYSHKEAFVYRDRASHIVNDLVELKKWERDQKNPIETHVKERMMFVLQKGKRP